MHLISSFSLFLQSCSKVLTNLLNTGMHISLLSMFKTVFRENKHGKIANCWWSNNFVLDRIQNIKGFLDMGKLSKAIWNNAVLLYCSTVIIFIDRWFNKGQQFLKCNSKGSMYFLEILVCFPAVEWKSILLQIIFKIWLFVKCEITCEHRNFYLDYYFCFLRVRSIHTELQEKLNYLLADPKLLTLITNDSTKGILLEFFQKYGDCANSCITKMILIMFLIRCSLKVRVVMISKVYSMVFISNFVSLKFQIGIQIQCLFFQY